MSESGKAREPAARWYRNPGLILPAVLVAFLLLTQWPMVKGLGYRLLGMPADTIPWRTNFAAALDESRQTGKPVLLDFSASWCPPCQIMKHEVWPDPAVEKAVTQGYIPVNMDADDHSSDEVAIRYGVDTIPRVIVVDAQGRVLKDGAFMDRDQLLQFLGAAKPNQE